MSPEATITVLRCETCHLSFVPRPGRCPKCGSGAITPHPIGARGTVLAATEVSVPPPEWPTPHRLALVEAEEGVRLLVVVRGDLPVIGDTVRLESTERGFAAIGRGEGDAPAAGTDRPPFEPPR
jgi:uncharacterized OB-fold protein